MSRWIPVLVRLEDYDTVTRLVAERELERPDNDFDQAVQLAEVPSAEARVAEPGELSERPLWSVEDLRRLAEGTTDTTERWTRALDVCAEQPGTYLPTSEVARRTGMSIPQWRDAPRKITRHLNKHYPNVPRDRRGDPVWPLHAKTRPEHPSEVSWAISPEMAVLWRQARSR